MTKGLPRAPVLCEIFFLSRTVLSLGFSCRRMEVEFLSSYIPWVLEVSNNQDSGPAPGHTDLGE